MDRSSLIFCIAALVGTLALSALLYPFTTISSDTLAAWRTPADAETLADVDLGDFGTVSVLELIEYYIENPPPPPAAGTQPERQVRFQGC